MGWKKWVKKGLKGGKKYGGKGAKTAYKYKDLGTVLLPPPLDKIPVLFDKIEDKKRKEELKKALKAIEQLHEENEELRSVIVALDELYDSNEEVRPFLDRLIIRSRKGDIPAIGGR
jgi:hypothetical protein